MINNLLGLAPYVQLDMNPLLPGNDKGVHKDAIFFSGRSFIGGVQSSSKFPSFHLLVN